MSFQPLVPLSGIAGLRFMERTQEAQLEVFNKSPQIEREIQYFKENISGALTAESLTDDFLLRKIALGAFGLDDDLPKKFFINKILSEGTDDREAFANRLVDGRYRELAQTFGYGNALGANVEQSDFAEKIISAYQTQKFERAVGDVDNSIRLAMNFKREIIDYTSENKATDTAWFQVMGNTPLRTVFEKAFNLPSSVGALDIERQLDIFKEKSQKILGSESLTALADPDKLDRIIRDFMIRDQLAGGSRAPVAGSAALSILQNSSLGSIGTANLLLSNI